MEWYERWNGEVYVSFSGGKDSTVLLDLARRVAPDIPAVFVDTGLEYPEIREFVKTKENVVWLHPIKYNKTTRDWERETFGHVIEKYGYPIISKRIAQYIKSAKNNPECVCAQYLRGEVEGSIFGGGGKYAYLVDAPFKISDDCCSAMKKRPMKKYAKETGRYPIIGTMTDESSMRKNAWLKNGCNAFDKADPSSQPLSFWREQDILKYIKEYNIEYCSIYGEIVCTTTNKLKCSGESRTGCMFCMFGCHLEKEPNRFQRMKQTHPRQWEYCIKGGEINEDGFWEPNKEGLGLGHLLDYIGVPYE